MLELADLASVSLHLLNWEDEKRMRPGPGNSTERRTYDVDAGVFLEASRRGQSSRTRVSCGSEVLAACRRLKVAKSMRTKLGRIEVRL